MGLIKLVNQWVYRHSRKPEHYKRVKNPRKGRESAAFRGNFFEIFQKALDNFTVLWYSIGWKNLSQRKAVSNHDLQQEIH